MDTLKAITQLLGVQDVEIRDFRLFPKSGRAEFDTATQIPSFPTEICAGFKTAPQELPKNPPKFPFTPPVPEKFIWPSSGW